MTSCPHVLKWRCVFLTTLRFTNYDSDGNPAFIGLIFLLGEDLIRRMQTRIISMIRWKVWPGDTFNIVLSNKASRTKYSQKKILRMKFIKLTAQESKKWLFRLRSMKSCDGGAKQGVGERWGFKQATFKGKNVVFFWVNV
jgi:hypothetical protein